MSTWIYRKPEATHIRGLCLLCNKRKQKRTSKGKYQALCRPCEDIRFGIKRKYYLKKYRRGKKLYCERCSFIAEDKCQLDVHHIDRNHHNNDPNNLVTLCSNCHRLEHKNEMNKKKNPRPPS